MITIAGCGSLGGLLAWRLAASGRPLQIFQRKGATLDGLRSRGIALEEGGTVTSFPVRAEDDPALLEKADLAIIAVKAFDTGALAPVLPALIKPHGAVLTVQNGLGNGEKLARVLGPERVAMGPCTYGAYRDPSGVLHPGGEGEILFGPLRAGWDWKAAETALLESGLTARLVADPSRAVWEKAVINAAINPIAALTGRENGGILSFPGAKALCRSLTKEACLAAACAGVFADPADMWLRVRDVIEKTAENRCSMLQDVSSGRNTEIDSISGEILAAGRSGGLELPRTETVFALIKALNLTVV